MEWYVWVVLVVTGIISIVYIYVYVVKDWLEYRQARKEIFTFVKSYKRRCTGSNRFVVTVETLQNSFRTYNTNIILNVWMELVNERVIELDAQDSEWVIK